RCTRRARRAPRRTQALARAARGRPRYGRWIGSWLARLAGWLIRFAGRSSGLDLERLEALELAHVLLGDLARFLGVGDDARGDQDDEFGAVVVVSRRAEQLAEDRDLAEPRHTRFRVGRVVLDETAEQDRFAA